jgi:hypothetical protein
MLNQDLLNGDLYVVYEGMTDDRKRAVVSAHLNPLVNWIWVGGAVLVFGTLVALLPSLPSGGTTPAHSPIARVTTPQPLKEKDEVLA